MPKKKLSDIEKRQRKKQTREVERLRHQSKKNAAATSDSSTSKTPTKLEAQQRKKRENERKWQARKLKKKAAAKSDKSEEDDDDEEDHGKARAREKKHVRIQGIATAADLMARFNAIRGKCAVSSSDDASDEECCNKPSTSTSGCRHKDVVSHLPGVFICLVSHVIKMLCAVMSEKPTTSTTARPRFKPTTRLIKTAKHRVHPLTKQQHQFSWTSASKYDDIIDAVIKGGESTLSESRR